ncbi:hypothetical protein B0J17DRAFT_629010 [Rhizoctonia solani]|nr:hypothetical protein B0J17DRAFT_629010 [Rhizoctonia solani]
MVAGAFMASVRETSRPDPGGLPNLVHASPPRTLSTLAQIKVLQKAPTLKTEPSARVARLVRSKALAGWGRSSCRPSTPVNSPVLSTPCRSTIQPSRLTESLYINHTTSIQSSEAVSFGPASYEGPKDLVVIDDRRALVVYGSHGPRALVVYSRPCSLSLYTGPINYIQFWVDTRNYELIASIYQPRFQAGSWLFKEYAHLNPASFEKRKYQTTEDPIDILLSGDRSILREMFDLVPSKYLTIGDFKRRPEEWTSRVLAHLYALGIVVSLVCMTVEEFSELQQALAESPASFIHSDSAILGHIETQIPLDEMAEETAPCTTDEWWNGGKKEIGKVDVVTTHFDTFISHPITSLDSPTPISVPTRPTQAPAPAPAPTPTPISSRAAKMMALAQRPSGPRFKSAAWKRCKTKFRMIALCNKNESGSPPFCRPVDTCWCFASL